MYCALSRHSKGALGYANFEAVCMRSLHLYEVLCVSQSVFHILLFEIVQKVFLAAKGSSICPHYGQFVLFVTSEFQCV